MRLDRERISPTCDDRIDASPERKLRLLNVFTAFGNAVAATDMLEQPHPEGRKCLMIEIFNAMMRGERLDALAHFGQGLIRRQLGQIA